MMSVLMLSPTNVSGYTNGIETGDIMDIEYEGRYADTLEIFDSNRVDFTIRMGEGALIEGFYKGLLGLKVGDSTEIDVPADEGYTEANAPTPELANRALVFNVKIHAIVEDINPGNDDESSGNLSGTIGTVLKVIGFLVVSVLVIIGIYGLRSKAISADCVHCASMGRKHVTAEGKCSKCGLAYCRASFSRRCPNCKGNSFIPN